MSYARQVKKEVATIQTTLEDDKAILYGYIKLKGEIGLSHDGVRLDLSTTSNTITRKMAATLKKLYNANYEMYSKSQSKLKGQTMFVIRIQDGLKDILIDLDLSSDGYLINEEVSDKYEAKIEKVITGMFLAKGSINDPDKTKRYHLEIVCSNENEANYIIRGLSYYDIHAKCIVREKGHVVYLKKSEAIGDFLKLIGAYNELYRFEDARIKRDYENYANRMVNCDLANGARFEEATNRQLAAIKKIEETIGYAALSPRLIGAVLLRIDYPDYTLGDLSEVCSEDSTYFGKPMSKSGISHCLREIEEIASKL